MTSETTTNETRDESDETSTVLGQVSDDDLAFAESEYEKEVEREGALAKVSFEHVVAAFPSEYFDAKLEFWLQRWRERLARGETPRNVESFRELCRELHVVVHASLAGDTLLVAGVSVDSATKFRERYCVAIDIMAECLRSRRDGGHQMTPTVTADLLGRVLRARLEGTPDPLTDGSRVSTSHSSYDVDRNRARVWTPQG